MKNSEYSNNNKRGRVSIDNLIVMLVPIIIKIKVGSQNAPGTLDMIHHYPNQLVTIYS